MSFTFSYGNGNAKSPGAQATKPAAAPAPGDLIKDSTQDTFMADVIEGSKEVPVLVDFWADWCQPCQMLMPILAKLADEYQGKFILAKCDTDANQEIAMQLGIRSLPTVKLFVDGQPVDEFMGTKPES